MKPNIYEYLKEKLTSFHRLHFSFILLFFALLRISFSIAKTEDGKPPVPPNKRDTIHATPIKPVTKGELVYMVDSILDLDTISSQAEQYARY